MIACVSCAIVTCVCVCVCVTCDTSSEMYQMSHREMYGVATISRLLKIIDHFCKRALQKRRYSAKEPYNFKEPTNRSHPISNVTHAHI